MRTAQAAARAGVGSLACVPFCARSLAIAGRGRPELQRSSSCHGSSILWPISLRSASPDPGRPASERADCPRTHSLSNVTVPAPPAHPKPRAVRDQGRRAAAGAGGAVTALIYPARAGADRVQGRRAAAGAGGAGAPGGAPDRRGCVQRPDLHPEGAPYPTPILHSPTAQGVDPPLRAGALCSL